MPNTKALVTASARRDACIVSSPIPRQFVVDHPDPAADTNAALQTKPNPKVHKDPVCGMSVEPFKAAASIEHAGRLYHFCSKGCAEKFSGDPAKYLSAGYIPGGMSSPVMIRGIATAPAAKPAATRQSYRRRKLLLLSLQRPISAPWTPRFASPSRSVPEVRHGAGTRMPLPTTRTQWTCPMHPEIVRDEPGSCPICGMALEPMTVAAEEEENPELHDMTRRFWWSVALGIPAGVVRDVAHGATRAPGFARARQLDRVPAGDADRVCGAAGHSSSAAGRR